MIQNFVIVSSLERIQKQFSVSLGDYSLPIAIPHLLTQHTCGYVITSEDNRSLRQMRFGLTPQWAKERMDIMNARAEGDKNPRNDPYYNGPNAIFLKPAFKRAIQNYRCLVVVDAFIAIGSLDQPFMAYVTKKRNPFVLAGIYDYWENPETKILSAGFAIVTVSANEFYQQIGIKRMPVIFTRENCTGWIRPSKPLNYYLPKLQACQDELINAYPISCEYQNGLTDINILKPIGKRLRSEVVQVNSVPRSHYGKKQKHEQTTTIKTLAERNKT